jgi:hypothetical protein
MMLGHWQFSKTLGILIRVGMILRRDLYVIRGCKEGY